MQAISVFQHTRSIQKIEALCKLLDNSGFSSEELMQNCNELQELYEDHQKLILELKKKEEDYYRHSKKVRQYYRFQMKKLKA